MQFDARQVVAATLTTAMFVMLINMMSNDRFFSLSSKHKLQETLEESKKMEASVVEDELWGRPGPVLRPCWNNPTSTRPGRTWGYVAVTLSNGPQYHPLQITEAIIVARHLEATLLLPKVAEAKKEPDGAFHKIYDVNNFISSLKDVVRVVGKLPDEIEGLKPATIKVPYGAKPEYIDKHVSPIFKKSRIIRLTIIFSPSSLKDEDASAMEDVKEIRCLVAHSALRFHSDVQKIGERVISRVNKDGGVRFIAVDLRLDALRRKGCAQADSSNGKKCYNANDVSTFLKRLGFSADTPIYVTQSRWDGSLAPIKEKFPNVYTKEDDMLSSGEMQGLGNTQLERAVDMYVCTRSDVFVPAISGLAYLGVAGERIAIGKTQILIPTISTQRDIHTKLKAPQVLSRFITRNDHSTTSSCLCQASAD